MIVLDPSSEEAAEKFKKDSLEYIKKRNTKDLALTTLVKLGILNEDESLTEEYNDVDEDKIEIVSKPSYRRAKARHKKGD